jgi:serine/threonine protein kinase/tetratricopeptide (TPR) repeat protein
MELRRWRQIERFYHAALARPVEERAAFLEGACAGDEALRHEVEALLDIPPTVEGVSTTPALGSAPRMAREPEALVLSGLRLGVYQLRERIGAGAMGEVYRAQDTRLGRQVAIKILPPAVADDPARRARFEREAQLLASLNHPNIATIYGVEESAAMRALVMELVEGETLAERITRSSAIDAPALSVDGTGIPMDEALALAQQIAEALEAAHQKKIIHRDLKPANIKITPAAKVKVLDFGLAKALTDQELENEAKHIGAPSDVSRDGLVMGTAAYMSPEQSQGQSLDTRTDVWAFGCVMYEMLTGRSAFARTTIIDTLAALRTDEPDWAALPAATPAGIRRLMERCLAKDARNRLSDIKDVVIEIDALRREASHQDDPWLRRDRRPTLVILPFTNSGSDYTTDYLAAGITESIVNRLALLPQLRVITANRLTRDEGQTVDPQTIARQLEADAVVTGKVVRTGARLIIRADLIDAVAGTRSWTDQYNRSLDDMLGIQDEIAAKIVESLRLRLTPEEKRRLVKRPTASSAAYQHYLRGRHHWSKRTAVGFTRAIECFESAIRTDPDFALAHAGIADCYAVLSFYDAGPTIQFHQRAKHAAATAVALDDTLADAHVSLGHILLNYDWDWPAAEKELQLALALAPGCSEAHHVYANYLSTIGHMEDSIREFHRSLECDPVSLPVNAGLGVTLYFARQYDAAVRQLLKTLELDERYGPAYAFLSWTYSERGLDAEAIAASEKALALMDAPWILVSLGYAHARAGHRSAAQQVLTTLLERAARQYVSPYDLAVMNAALGERGRGLALLEAAYDERSVLLVWGLLQDPRLDSLRHEAAFVDLRRRVGLAAQDQQR